MKQGPQKDVVTERAHSKQVRSSEKRSRWSGSASDLTLLTADDKAEPTASYSHAMACLVAACEQFARLHSSTSVPSLSQFFLRLLGVQTRKPSCQRLAMVMAAAAASASTFVIRGLQSPHCMLPPLSLPVPLHRSHSLPAQKPVLLPPYIPPCRFHLAPPIKPPRSPRPIPSPCSSSAACQRSPSTLVWKEKLKQKNGWMRERVRE